MRDQKLLTKILWDIIGNLDDTKALILWTNFKYFYQSMKTISSYKKWILIDKNKFNNFVEPENIFLRNIKWYKVILKNRAYSSYMEAYDLQNKEKKLRKSGLKAWDKTYSKVTIKAKPIDEKDANKIKWTLKKDVKTYLKNFILYWEINIVFSENLAWIKSALKSGIINEKLNSEQFRRLRQLYLLYDDLVIPTHNEYNKSIESSFKRASKWYVPHTQIIYNKNWGK